jgi:hypothetical protein
MPSTNSQPDPLPKENPANPAAAAMVQEAARLSDDTETMLHALSRIADRPKEPILILGLMEHNSRTIASMLARLPRDREDYRGNLRVLRGAARELIGYVDGLLGGE